MPPGIRSPDGSTATPQDGSLQNDLATGTTKRRTTGGNRIGLPVASQIPTKIPTNLILVDFRLVGGTNFEIFKFLTELRHFWDIRLGPSFGSNPNKSVGIPTQFEFHSNNDTILWESCFHRKPFVVCSILSVFRQHPVGRFLVCRNYD